MTRERALKRVIRDRAARTGERYTTARRHVLASRAPTSSAPTAPRAPSDHSSSPVSDEKILEKTGHRLDYWFAQLDRFGAMDKGHTAIARHLYQDHAVPGWHAQGITVAYERARGLRAVNQRLDGAYEVSVSKVMAANIGTVINALTSPAMRRGWAEGVSPDLIAALASAIRDKSSKGFVVRADGFGKFRYKWNDTTVQFYLEPKPGGKTSVIVQHAKLPGASSVEQHRAQWKKALGAVATLVAKSG